MAKQSAQINKEIVEMQAKALMEDDPTLSITEARKMAREIQQTSAEVLALMDEVISSHPILRQLKMPGQQ